MATPVQHRVGDWLPQDQQVLETWVARQIAKIDPSKTFAPVIQDFQNLIEQDPEIYMAFHQMFDQVPTKPPYNQDPTKKQSKVRDYMTMLQLFDQIIAQAPDFENDVFVGFPINAILDWPMGTTGGLTAFVNPKVNAQFKAMLGVWSTYLGSSASCNVLTTAANGWFGPTATSVMPGFAETFVCEPSAPYYGFTSWDNFFTRLFRPGLRPVDSPDNDSIVNSACESTVYQITRKVQALNTFWIKEEAYSLNHMLYNDPLAAHPVNGTIVKTLLVPGTYYAESPAMGFQNPTRPDPAADDNSQGFISAVATRALIFIQADNPSIGLMCFIAVGMAEVSSCEIVAEGGQVVKKGDQMGMFHFGGSTHCLIFRPETNITFNPAYPVKTPIKLSAELATVT